MDSLTLVRACDIEPRTHKVIKGRLPAYQPASLYLDINHRLPVEVLDKLKDIEDMHGVNAKAHDMQLTFLMENRLKIFNDKQTCKDFMTFSNQHTQLWTSAQISSCKSPGGPTLPVGNQEGQEDLCTIGRPLFVHAAGADCLGFTPRGGHDGDDHASCRQFNIWITERKALAEQCVEDVFFHENASTFPLRKFDPLESTHEVRSMKINCETMGWCMSRERTLSCGINTKTAIWLGASDYESEFNQLFGQRHPNIDPVKFFVDARENILAYVKEKLFNRGSFVPEGFDLESFDFTSLLTPGNLSRLSKFQELKDSGSGAGRLLTLALLFRSLFFLSSFPPLSHLTSTPCPSTLLSRLLTRLAPLTPSTCSSLSHCR
eukprot:3295585-Pyramimonas_sp.AAC.1